MAGPDRIKAAFHGGADDRDRTGMASLEGPSGPAMFMRQSTSSQVRGGRSVRGWSLRRATFQPVRARVGHAILWGPGAEQALVDDGDRDVP